LVNNKKGIVLLLVSTLATTSSYATPSTWELTAPGNNNAKLNGTNRSNSVSFEQNGLDLNITAWPDIGERNKIQQSTVGQINPSLTNQNKHRDVKHLLPNTDNFELLLLDFATSVPPTSLNLDSFVYHSIASPVALNKKPVINQPNSWSDAASHALFSTDFQNIGLNARAMTNQVSGPAVEARYWLVGAHNSVFAGSMHSTGNSMKIAGITSYTSPDVPPVSVDEPSTLSILVAFILIALWRGKRTPKPITLRYKPT
jgi:hypothetical protein